MEANVTETNDSSCQYASSSLNTFQFYAWGITANIIACYGIVGNILSIVVLRHRQMRNSTSYYLISLAVYDIIVLLSMSLFLAVPTLYSEKGILEGYYFTYPYLHPFVYPVALIGQTGTVYTTLAFTVERYIAVCKPLHAANMCTMSRTKKTIVFIFCASIAYNIPRFLEYQTRSMYDTYLNRTVAIPEFTEIGANKVFRQVYFIYSYLIVMFLLPFSLLTILNIMLIRAVNKARAKRNSISSSNSKETNLTVMLIVVINVFLGCQLPALIDNIMVAMFDYETVRCSTSWVQFTTISNLMVVVNSAINFILYCLLSKRFRRVFFKIFYFRKSEPKFKYTVHQSSHYNLRQVRVNQTGTRVYDVTSSLL